MVVHVCRAVLNALSLARSCFAGAISELSPATNARLESILPYMERTLARTADLSRHRHGPLGRYHPGLGRDPGEPPLLMRRPRAFPLRTPTLPPLGARDLIAAQAERRVGIETAGREGIGRTRATRHELTVQAEDAIYQPVKDAVVVRIGRLQTGERGTRALPGCRVWH